MIPTSDLPTHKKVMSRTSLDGLKESMIRVSVGLVYLLFGVLKFFPGASPAEELAKQTLYVISFGLLPISFSYQSLAVWETLIGCLLIFNIKPRITAILGLCHMFGTFLPLILFPNLSYENSFSFSLIGQYIVKNIIIVSVFITMLPNADYQS